MGWEVFFIVMCYLLPIALFCTFSWKTRTTLKKKLLFYEQKINRVSDISYTGSKHSIMSEDSFTSGVIYPDAPPSTPRATRQVSVHIKFPVVKFGNNPKNKVQQDVKKKLFRQRNWMSTYSVLIVYALQMISQLKRKNPP